MATISGFSYSQDAVRVRVKKYKENQPPENRKFSIDPEITTFEVLQSIIAKAFDIKESFILNYRAYDDLGQETLLPLLSDWDLDAAFLHASDPCLSINIDTRVSEGQAWVKEERIFDEPTKDVFGTIEIPRNHLVDSKPPNRLPGLIMNRVEKTFNIFQRAFNLGDEVPASATSPCRPPLADSEFRKFLDPIGQITRMKELRSVIYFGGVEPSLRKVVWKHILNVYPNGMSGRERMDYMKRKTQEYESLRESWRQCLVQGRLGDELSYVTSMVRKDVLRTDRHHKFYAGSDDNQNIASLFNILTTYALNHPSVSYCQGMSDLASPLLVTMGDEAHAYICFCALMSRLKPNFMLDGEIMTLKFQHLTEGLTQCDPQFYAYLKMHQAEDLLFCYRWLLLEMKREFAFDDALHMLEVLWSSLDATPPTEELPLYEVKFSISTGTPPISPLVRTSRESPYTKVCALRRQSSSMSLNALSSSRRLKAQRQNQSLDESSLDRQNRLRKQGRIKPFFSLDDNCMEMLDSPVRNSHSASAVNKCGEIDPLTLMKMRVNSMNSNNKNGTLSSSTGNLIEAGNKRNLQRRTGDGKSSTSLSKLSEKENEDIKASKVYKGRTVKNFNEFLNLTSRGRSLRPRQRSQCSSISEADVFDGPSITVTRSGSELDGGSDLESDRSSLKQASSPSHSSSVSPNVFDHPPSDESSPEPFTAPPPPSRSDSSPDDSTDYCPITTSMTRELRLELNNLDRQVLAQKSNQNPPRKEPSVFVWENPMPTTPDEQVELEMDEAAIEPHNENGEPLRGEEAAEVPNFLARSALTTSSFLHSIRSARILQSPTRAFYSLPPPEEFGGGNPFLMFLCLTLLRQHRDFIMHNKMDYNDLAMYFDKMVRKHNVTRVLEEARQMFASYLKQQSLQSSQNGKQNCKV